MWLCYTFILTDSKGKNMKVGGLIFTLGLWIMIIGVWVLDFAVSMVISWTGLFIMWASVIVMINEKLMLLFIDNDFRNYD